MRNKEFFDWIEALPTDVKRELLQSSQAVRFPKNAIIYERMAETKGVYRLLEGRVRLFLMRDTGSVLLLKICEPGETIGDLTSVDGHHFPVFAEAMTDVKTSFIKSRHFNAMRAVHPEINAALVVQISSALRSLISLLNRVTMHSIEKQVAGRLQWLKRSQDMRSGVSGPITISQNDLALMIGASRQTVNKALAKLEARGLIIKHYGTITVLDDNALEQFLIRQRP